MPETQQQNRKTQARKAMYRRLAIEAAERVFAAQGYAGTRMQDVAAEAGMALGTLYGICAGKEELYGAVHQQRGAQMLARAAETAAQASSPLEALRLGIRSYVAFLAEHPDYLRLHLQEDQPWALSPRFISETQRSQWRQGLSLTVEVFRAGIADGSFVDEDPSHMARVMIAAHQVFLVEWLEDDKRQPVGALVDRMIAFVERSFCR